MNASPETIIKALIKKITPMIFLISILIKIQADLFYYQQQFYPSWSNIRHILFLLILILLWLVYLGQENRKKWTRPVVNMIVFSILSLLISLGMSLYAKQPVSRALEISFLQTTPVIMVYFFINVYSKREIDTFIRSIFVVLFFRYLINKVALLVVPSNWLQIDFFSSYSPFESSAMSGYFYGFLIYFCLFDRNKFFLFLSFTANFLVFKRLNVIFSVILLFFGGRISKDSKIKESTKWILIIIFTIIPIIEYRILLGSHFETILKIFPQFDLKGMLMGRDWFFNVLVNNNFKGYGLGSVGNELFKLIGRKGLELDGVQIYMELGILGVFGISYVYWNFAEKYLKNIIIIFLFMINYLTSAQLSDSYSVFLNLLTISMISVYGTFSNKK